MKQSIFRSHLSSDGVLFRRKDASLHLKLILELGPLIVFFLVNFNGQWFLDNISLFSSFKKPIFPATAIFMVVVVIALVASWIINHKIPIIAFISGIFVLIFGSLTLWLNYDHFIKMKLTIINLLFSCMLFGGLFFKRSLLNHVFDSTLQLDAEGWRKLTWYWAYFLLFLAILNEIIWRNFSDDFWANFKVFGIMPIMICFTLIQRPLIIRHAIKQNFDEESADLQTQHRKLS